MEEKKTRPRKGWKKILIILSLTIIGLVALVIIFISPIAKYLIQKYDVKYTGREITLKWAYINPFTGYVHLSGLKVYEQKSDTVFFSFNGLSVNLEMLKLLHKTYEISSVTLNHPIGVVVMNKDKKFNFSDLIDKFSSKEPADTTKPPVHFNLLDVNIKDGEFYYKDRITPVNYSIEKFNFDSKGKKWDVDSIAANYSFIVGQGSGSLKGDLMLNVNNKNYRLSTVITKLDSKLFDQYLRDISRYGTLSAFVDADLKVKGNLKDKQNVSFKGTLEVSKFHFGKNKNEDYAAFDKLRVGIKELAPLNKKYFFDTILLAHPYFKYERYDSLDNLQRMFGSKGSKVKAVKGDPEKFNLILEIGKYVKTLFKNFLKSDYKVGNLAIKQGDIHYNDFALSEKFAVALSPLSIKGDSIDNTNHWVSLYLESGLKPHGSFNVSVSMNPKNNKDFDLHYKLQRIPAPLFNPYLITFTSFPLDRGVIDIHGKWNVRNDIIESDNRFLIVDLRTTKRLRKKDTKWIPVPLIMSVIRERGNVIDYEIPVTGNLKDPKFHLLDVIVDIVQNILIKPPTTPYRIHVDNTEREVERSMRINWAMRQTILTRQQEKFLGKIADFLEDNPTANLTIAPKIYAEKEKEYITFFEAKKKYFFFNNHGNAANMTEGDSILIDKMSIKDKAFVKYLDNNIKDSMVFTVQEKCGRLLGKGFADKKLAALQHIRQRAFLDYFKENNTDGQLKFIASENTVPFNGFTNFRINYKGEVPEELLDAYEKLNDIYNEAPRDKYIKFRKGRFNSFEKQLSLK